MLREALGLDVGIGEGQALFRVVGVIAPGDGGVEAVLRVVFRDGNVDVYTVGSYCMPSTRPFTSSTV